MRWCQNDKTVVLAHPYEGQNGLKRDDIHSNDRANFLKKPADQRCDYFEDEIAPWLRKRPSNEGPSMEVPPADIETSQALLLRA